MTRPKPIQPEEARALDELKYQVDNGVGRPGMEHFAECFSDPPLPLEMYPHFINIAEEDPHVWELLLAALARQRRDRPTASIDRPLLDWALDIAQGKREQPQRRGRQAITNFGRNGMIVLTVDTIRSMGHRPATSNKPEPESSACGLVAKRLNLSYEAVRTIWQDERHRTVARPVVHVVLHWQAGRG